MRIVLAACLGATLGLGLAGVTHAEALPKCAEEVTGPEASYADIMSHRIGHPAPITYTRSNAPEQFGFAVTFVVDETGRPICQSPFSGSPEDAPVMTPQRTAYLTNTLPQQSYQPFLVKGQPARVAVTEIIPEQILPTRHTAMPEGELSGVVIRMARFNCFEGCADYSVTVHGDGKVEYVGMKFSDVEGTHTYIIPPEDVAALIQHLRERNIWSMDGAYGDTTQMDIDYGPKYWLDFTIGGQNKTIRDFTGPGYGMPLVISETEADIDSVSGVIGLVRLSSHGMDILQAEGFDFTSREAADLLARAVFNSDTTDSVALLRLIEAGAPLDGKAESRFGQQPDPVLDEALRNHHVALVAPLMARGALRTDGHIDQVKLDNAFQAAIEGGRLAGVQAIWDAGEDLRPSLTFEDSYARDNEVEQRKKTVPVTLLLNAGDDPAWEGLAIARWLAEKGCDLKASLTNGNTLLHIAADPGDPEFVRYLLDQGFDASTPGQYGLPALGGTRNEDVALMLLEAGTDPAMNDTDASQFRRYAQYNHWTRVIAWLDAHKR